MQQRAADTENGLGISHMSQPNHLTHHHPSISSFSRTTHHHQTAGLEIQIALFHLSAKNKQDICLFNYQLHLIVHFMGKSLRPHELHVFHPFFIFHPYSHTPFEYTQMRFKKNRDCKMVVEFFTKRTSCGVCV